MPTHEAPAETRPEPAKTPPAETVLHTAGPRTNRRDRANGSRAESTSPGGHGVSRWTTKGPYESQEVFRRFAQRTAHGAGHPWAFAVALAVVVLWGLSGPLFGFSNTWQLVINSTTTILTFLMVFLIQNTQSRDSHAIHLKLDELIRTHRSARRIMLAAEDLTDAELDELSAEFARQAKERIRKRTPRHGERGGPPSSTSSSVIGPTSPRTTRPSGSAAPVERPKPVV